MFDFLLGWPLTIASAIVLSVLANLMTPRVADVFASINYKRRTRHVSRIFGEYCRLAEAKQGGYATFDGLVVQGRAIFWMINYALISLGIISISNLNFIRKNFTLKDPFAALDQSNVDMIFISASIALYLVLVVCGYFIIKNIFLLGKYRELIRSPEKFYDRTARRIKRLDPGFDVSRLPRLPETTRNDEPSTALFS